MRIAGMWTSIGKSSPNNNGGWKLQTSPLTRNGIESGAAAEDHERWLLLQLYRRRQRAP